MPRSVREIGLLLLLTGLGLVILFSSLPKNETGFFSETLNTIIRPFYSSMFFVKDNVKRLLNSYLLLVTVSQENEFLKKENARLRMDNAGLMEKDHENRRLKNFLVLKTSLDYPSILAQVIGLDASGVYRTVFINRGREDGITYNMPVMVSDGVVGKILGASAKMSQVGLITDPSVSIDARIDRTRDRGVVVGDSNNACVMKYLNRKASLKPGDKVITSGLDGVFPKGLLIGVVESVQPGQQGLFLEARVQPTANFFEMEEVLIILTKHGGFYIEPGFDVSK
jgi:rod shape-determining protein MreC